MQRSRRRKAGIRVESLEARIALSGDLAVLPIETLTTADGDAGPPAEIAPAESKVRPIGEADGIVAEPLPLPDGEGTDDQLMVTTTRVVDDRDQPVSATDESLASTTTIGNDGSGELPVSDTDAPLRTTTGLPDADDTRNVTETDSEVDPRLVYATTISGEVDPIAYNRPAGAPPVNATAIRNLIDSRREAATTPPTTTPPPTSRPIAPPIGRALGISGAVRGEAVRLNNGNAVDGHFTTKLQGDGLVTPLGRSSLSGTLKQPEVFIQVAGYHDLTGTVTLNNPRGRVTLDLTGSRTPNRPGGPIRLEATVVAATGAYSSLRGLGTATLRLNGANFMMGLSLAPPRR